MVLYTNGLYLKAILFNSIREKLSKYGLYLYLEIASDVEGLESLTYNPETSSAWVRSREMLW